MLPNYYNRSISDTASLCNCCTKAIVNFFWALILCSLLNNLLYRPKKYQIKQALNRCTPSTGPRLDPFDA